MLSCMTIATAIRKKFIDRWEEIKHHLFTGNVIVESLKKVIKKIRNKGCKVQYQNKRKLNLNFFLWI